MPKRLIAFILLLALWSPYTFAAPVSPQRRIAQLLAQPGQKKTHFAIHFLDLATDKTIYQHNPDTPLIPASNMKLITTTAALDQLGPQFTYQTVVALLQGHLAVFAAGDPLIGDPVIAANLDQPIDFIFQQIHHQLQQRKISAITGDLLIDDTIFDDLRFHPSWPDKDADKWWTAQVSALNFNDNCLDVTITPTTPGKLAAYSLMPDTAYIDLTNKCTTGPKNKSGATRRLGTNEITLIGSCKSTYTFSVTIERPSAFFGYCLVEYLQKNGIDIQGKLIIKRLRDQNGNIPADADILFTHTTPLPEVLARCNRRSLNLAAECLFKTLGAYHNLAPGQNNAQGSWQTGAAAVTDFLKKLDVPPEQFNIDDGSGLSNKNRLSPRTLTTVLAYVHRQPYAQLFRDSLATPATGTLKKRKRFAESTYHDRIYAKTGFIAGARALSGYAQTKTGRQLAFAIITNDSNYNSTKTIDKIVKEIIK